MRIQIKLLGALYCAFALLQCPLALAGSDAAFSHSAPSLFRTGAADYTLLHPCTRHSPDVEHQLDRELSESSANLDSGMAAKNGNLTVTAFSVTRNGMGSEGTESISASENDIVLPDDVVAETVVLGVIGLNATKSNVYEGRYAGWVSLEPGIRPAYVGIHGGTAPITLLRSPEGALFAYTGSTGNDFLQILRGRGLTDKTRQVPQEVISLKSRQAPAAGSRKTNPPLSSQAAPGGSVAAPFVKKTAGANVRSGGMLPFGLSNPDGLVLVLDEVDKKKDKDTQALLDKAGDRQPDAPSSLSLRSYINLLSGL